ncbi:N-acetylmannosamine-6-phosphate 2-epimerase [Paenibacillus sp. M1]|uniref:Putative N-acetylmannosamine-6-phosphate 2-epimerase n=1 Tax=Paenibacillus haidiansis TaxID=1574488 RepID=A0ABU7VXK3_9BACL
MKNPIIASFQGGLIVSCQALEGEAFYGGEYMAKFAICAEAGDAVGIRANTPADIKAIKAVTKLPLIGLWKQDYDGYEVYITPTLREVEEVIAAGADIVAMDATLRDRPGGVPLQTIVRETKRAHPEVLLMADVSTTEEGIAAEQAGFDLISTTLSGYTPYSPQSSDPDFELIAELSRRVSIPVLGEGRIHTPEQAVRCLREGAFAVVVGGAITRPDTITRKYTEAMAQFIDE